MGFLDRMLVQLRHRRLAVVARIRTAWTAFGNADCFQLLDGMCLVGATSTRPRQEWRRAIWYFMNSLASFQFCIMITNMIYALVHDESLYLTTWYLTAGTGLVASQSMTSLSRFYAKELTQVQKFINCRFVVSGDASYDDAVRRRFDRRTRIGARVILVTLGLNQIVFLSPNPHREQMFRFLLDRYFPDGSLLARVLHDAYQYPFWIIWIGRHLWCNGMLTMLLLGLQAEAKILTQKFEKDLVRMKSLLTSKNFDSKKNKRRLPARDKFWKQLIADVEITVEQHLELIRYIQLLEPFIGKFLLLFFIFSLFGFGSVMFMMLDQRKSFVTMLLGLTLAAMITECYFFCRLVESLQDANEAIHVTVYEMCARLPYDAKFCSRYRQMRTSLTIIAIYTANAGKLMCAGTVPIDMTTFAGLLDNSYSMLKFLLGFRK